MSSFGRHRRLTWHFGDTHLSGFFAVDRFVIVKFFSTNWAVAKQREEESSDRKTKEEIREEKSSDRRSKNF